MTDPHDLTRKLQKDNGSKIVLVVAVAQNGVIGRDGDLPWRLPSDLKRFKQLTLGKPLHIISRIKGEKLASEFHVSIDVARNKLDNAASFLP